MQTIHQKARERMQGFCRVCRVCDGRACAGEVPGMGGIGTGASFFANIDALAACRLNMRLIHNVTELDTTVTILVDGGIRSGGDVLKMLALGADAAMIGRPFSIANMGDLQEGVQKLIDQIKSELVQAMILTGTEKLTDVDRSILYNKTI